jgi:hypothetical protein
MAADVKTGREGEMERRKPAETGAMTPVLHVSYCSVHPGNLATGTVVSLEAVTWEECRIPYTNQVRLTAD